MSKRTELKTLRTEHPELLRPEFVDGIEREMYQCPVCGEAMLLSVGQIQKCHRHCRHEYKRIVKYQREHARMVPYPIVHDK